jgi:hypothetical protein
LPLAGSMIAYAPCWPLSPTATIWLPSHVAPLASGSGVDGSNATGSQVHVAEPWAAGAAAGAGAGAGAGGEDFPHATRATIATLHRTPAL